MIDALSSEQRGFTLDSLHGARNQVVMASDCTVFRRRSALYRTVLACALTAGCNSLLDNVEHDVALGDAAAIPSSRDAGPDGITGATDSAADDSAANESGVADWDAQDTDALTPIVDAGSETGGGDGDGPPIAFVQVASHDTKTSVTTVHVPYSGAQHAGDFDIVVVGWTDPTNSIRSVSDSAGNAYTLAAPLSSTSGVALAIYYAAHIAAAASNTVTIDFDIDDFPCITLLEYSGVSQVDQHASGTGSSDTASSGAVVTSVARELLIGAGEPDQNRNEFFATAGAGFNERALTNISGMLVEDSIVSQAGSYTATGGLTNASAWVMQIVTFK